MNIMTMIILMNIIIEHKKMLYLQKVEHFFYDENFNS
jgi:hypothetical protein